jgi:hypothetical protein
VWVIHFKNELKMKKAIIIVIVFLAGSSSLLAQNEETNLQKYWHYRHRLVNYYMVVGQGNGKSLPADIRNHYAFSSNVIRWGEAPAYQGYYLGVLASEFRLLKDYGQNTDQTLTELYYALLAIERIDYNAESAWNYPNSIDGLLIRDDVPVNFALNNYNQLNNDIPPNNQGVTIGSGKPGLVNVTASDYYANYLANRPEDNVVSMDVIFSLLMGYALVKDLVDAGSLSFYNYITNSLMQVDMRAMAIDETDRIISHIKSGIPTSQWVIAQPDGSFDAQQGALVNGLSYPLAIAGNFITGLNYEDGYTAADEFVWDDLTKEDILCDYISNGYSVHEMAMVLASISNSWKEYPGGSNDTPARILEVGDYNAGGSGECSYFDNHFGWDVFYGMLWDVLHGGPNYIGDLCKASQILSSAHWDGPFYHTSTDNAAAGSWCAARRFFEDPPRQVTGKLGFQGNYNGLDYMLLFNLYYLDARSQAAPMYVPEYDLTASNWSPDHYPFFLNQQYYGEFGNPWIVNALDFPVIVGEDPDHVIVYGNLSNGHGELRIEGNPQGVLITNTTVENFGTFQVFCNPVNALCNPVSGYYFDGTGYHYRMINSDTNGTTNALPPYLPSREFTKIANPDIAVYPNPASATATVQYVISGSGSVKIYLLDMAGKEVLSVVNISGQEPGMYTASIEVSNLPAGTYNCVLQVNNITTGVKKIIVEH